MTLSARIVGERIEVFDVMSGGIRASHSLPPGRYSNLIVSGDYASITIHRLYSQRVVRTIRMQNGALVREVSF